MIPLESTHPRVERELLNPELGVVIGEVQSRNEGEAVMDPGIEKVLPRSQGAGESSDNGYGYMVAADEGGGVPGTVRVWDFDRSPLQGSVVYTTSSGAGSAGHITHSNAAPGIPRSEQYACTADPTTITTPRADEVFCFLLDGSRDALVLTQDMAGLAAAGDVDGRGMPPNGNLDASGSYFIWVAEMPGGRADAFMVKVPGHLLRDPIPGAMLSVGAEAQAPIGQGSPQDPAAQ